MTGHTTTDTVVLGLDPTLPLTPIRPVRSAQTGEPDGQYVVWIQSSPEWTPCLFESRAEAAAWVDEYRAVTAPRAAGMPQ